MHHDVRNLLHINVCVLQIKVTRQTDSYVSKLGSINTRKNIVTGHTPWLPTTYSMLNSYQPI